MPTLPALACWPGTSSLDSRWWVLSRSTCWHAHTDCELRDVRGRRQALAFGALVLGAAALWPAQQMLVRVFGLPGAQERFTGSRESGSFAWQ